MQHSAYYHKILLFSHIYIYKLWRVKKNSSNHKLLQYESGIWMGVLLGARSTMPRDMPPFEVITQWLSNWYLARNCHPKKIDVLEVGHKLIRLCHPMGYTTQDGHLRYLGKMMSRAARFSGCHGLQSSQPWNPGPFWGFGTSPRWFLMGCCISISLYLHISPRFFCSKSIPVLLVNPFIPSFFRQTPHF